MVKQIVGFSMLSLGVVMLLFTLIVLFEPVRISLPIASLIGIPGVLLVALGAGVLIVEGEQLREDSAEDNELRSPTK